MAKPARSFPDPLPHDPAHQTRLTELQQLRRLSDLWDRAFAIPGTNFRVGIESLIGLLPGGGDLVGVGLSCYIVVRALQFGLPKSVLFQMLVNIAVDGLVGSVPILGDLFDTTWKANTKNVNLLEAHLQAPSPARKADRRFQVLFLIVLGLLALTLLLVTGLIIHFVVQLLTRSIG